MPGFFDQFKDIVLLVLGFGFVIFWHELGHFIAAKWAGVRVEQFAVGFGQALFSWRKGLGLRWGSSAAAVEAMVAKERELSGGKPGEDSSGKGTETKSLNTADESKQGFGLSGETDAQIQQRLGIDETEYRLNWIPLGGYVKMLGQDDLRPNSQADDPRAYNMKPISKRMVIVSAGVIMNVILAAIGFFVLFLIGFDVPPPVVGMVQPGSPAQKAGIRVGDRILELDGKPQRDFTKIQLNVALVKEGEIVPIKVQRPDGHIDDLNITAARSDSDKSGFLTLGIVQSRQLEGPVLGKLDKQQIEEMKGLVPEDQFAVRAGERIVAISDQPVQSPGETEEQAIKDYWKLDRAVQESGGKPIKLTVTDGKQSRDVVVKPRLADPFDGVLNFAGIVPRAAINSIMKESSARGKIQPGDVVESVTVNTDTKLHPTRDTLRRILLQAGSQDQKIDLVVIRDGQKIPVNGLTTVKLDGGVRGLGIVLDDDAGSAAIGTVLPDSPADRAGINVTDLADVVITMIGDQPIASFHDIKRVLAQAEPGNVPVVIQSDAGQKTVQLPLAAADIQSARDQMYRIDLLLHELSEPRKTTGFFQAARWGIEETRDLIVQFYVTLQRMFSGSVPAKNMMGPVGIVRAGALFAARGMDSLIWFLAMISANLAVVNFLPIPIVDGGLFVFLIIEKFQGKPLSPRVQSIAQLVGIALILSVFIFVTIQDIKR